MLVIICTFAYMAHSPFNSNTSRLFRLRFGFDIKTTGRLISIPYITALLTAPLLGLLISKIGYQSYFLILSTLLLTSAQIVMMLIPDCF